jgi:predicted Zn-dependent peptidase
MMPGIVAEVARLADDLDDSEVARAKAQLRAGLLMSLESPVSRASQIGRQTLIWGRPLSTAEVLAKIAAVDLPQVKRLAREIFSGSVPTMALVGPVAAAPSGEELTRHLRARA